MTGDAAHSAIHRTALKKTPCINGVEIALLTL